MDKTKHESIDYRPEHFRRLLNTAMFVASVMGALAGAIITLIASRGCN